MSTTDPVARRGRQRCRPVRWCPSDPRAPQPAMSSLLVALPGIRHQPLSVDRARPSSPTPSSGRRHTAPGSTTADVSGVVDPQHATCGGRIGRSEAPLYPPGTGRHAPPSRTHRVPPGIRSWRPLRLSGNHRAGCGSADRLLPTTWRRTWALTRSDPSPSPCLDRRLLGSQPRGALL